LRAGTSLSSRLSRIADALAGVIDAQKPEVAAVESLFFHKDAQAASKLGHARGVVLLCLERESVKIFEYAPARVKRTGVGHGQADKRQVALMVRAVLGLESPPPSDAADALALAITHLRIGTLLANVAVRKQPALPERLREVLARHRGRKPSRSNSAK
jgi:crossover junction endodeoxyribonuclease RuvC